MLHNPSFALCNNDSSFMVASCSIGDSALNIFSLYLAITVGCTHYQHIGAWQLWNPGPAPEHPAILRQRRVQGCLPPGSSIISTYLHLADTAMTCESQSSDFHRLTRLKLINRSIYSSDSM